MLGMYELSRQETDHFLDQMRVLHIYRGKHDLLHHGSYCRSINYIKDRHLVLVFNYCKRNLTTVFIEPWYSLYFITISMLKPLQHIKKGIYKDQELISL